MKRSFMIMADDETCQVTRALTSSAEASSLAEAGIPPEGTASEPASQADTSLESSHWLLCARALEIASSCQLPFGCRQRHEATSEDLRSELYRIAGASPCLWQPSDLAFFSPHQLIGTEVEKANCPLSVEE